jgi:hypothetical protein
MKRAILFLVVSLFFIRMAEPNSFGPQVKGRIVSESNNITVVHIWGTHWDRGFAYGYLLGSKIHSIVIDYLKPSLRDDYERARECFEAGHLNIAEKYIEEITAIIDGMVYAGLTDVEVMDILILNSLPDIMEILSAEKEHLFRLWGSSLISWGDAAGYPGLISTHLLDWDDNEVLNRNQIIVFSNPYELDEQPWCLVGFAGIITPLSGINKSGVSVHLQGAKNVDFYEPIYEYDHIPVLFALRNGLEKKDINNDRYNNTKDIMDALMESEKGILFTSIISIAGGKGSDMFDDNIGVIAEVTYREPKFVFRNFSYDDNI